MFSSWVGDVGGLKRVQMHMGKTTFPAVVTWNDSAIVRSLCRMPRSIGPGIRVESVNAVVNNGFFFFFFGIYR